MNQPRELVADALPSDPEFWAERLDMLSEMQGCGSSTMKECARIIRAYAATQPGASAGVEERARELLAAEYVADKRPMEVVNSILYEDFDALSYFQQRALRALAAALRTRAKTEGEVECPMCSRWKALSESADLLRSIAEKRAARLEATTQPAGRAAVTDEMVERACIAYYELPAWQFMSHKAACKDRMCAALTASFAGGGCG